MIGKNCTLRWLTKPAREFQSLSQSPSGFFPTPFPMCTQSTKYVDVEGYKSPSLLVLGAQTFGEQPPLSPPVLNKHLILQSLRVQLGSSARIQSRFSNINTNYSWVREGSYFVGNTRPVKNEYIFITKDYDTFYIWKFLSE